MSVARCCTAVVTALRSILLWGADSRISTTGAAPYCVCARGALATPPPARSTVGGGECQADGERSGAGARGARKRRGGGGGGA